MQDFSLCTIGLQRHLKHTICYAMLEEQTKRYKANVNSMT
jgi:hypothetical protein